MAFQDSTVLVTGGAGFIGSNLVERLLGEGARVRVLDDFSTGRRENLADLQAGHRADVQADGQADVQADSGPDHGSRFELVEASVTDFDACLEACRGADYVLHQAAIPSVARSVDDPGRTHDACATGTLNMLRAAHAAGARRFVYAGSSSAYGDTPTLPKQEDMPSRPRSPYAVAKLTGEHYAQVYPGLFGLDTVVLRYFNVFGPRQDPGSQYSAVIPLFITAALEGRAPTIHGDGGQTRDFTYIDNVVEANLKACLAPADRVSGLVFNVGCGDRISVLQLWHAIREIVGVDMDAIHVESRPGDVRDSLADLTRIRERLGYTGSVDLAEGLRRTVDWLRGIRAAG